MHSTSTARRKKIRVAHAGTGATGVLALRGILEHSDLELIGLYVSSPDKIGKDAGDLCNLGKTGISAIGDLDALIALKPDCLSYCGNGLGRESEAAEQISRFLSAGIDVATISLLPMLHARSAPAPLREILEPACARGASSFLATGLDPGFASDLLPIALLSMTNEIRSIRIIEIGDYSHYAVEPVIRGVLGFGQPPDYPAPIAAGHQFKHYWGGMVQQIADLLGLDVEEILEAHSIATHHEDIDTPVGIMEAGTVVARRMECSAIVDGERVIVIEHVTRLANNVAPDWVRFDGTGDAIYQVVIDGNPTIRCELDVGCNQGVPGGMYTTAMRMVNAIPSLVDAKPGLLGGLDLPLYVGRNVRFKNMA